MAAVILAVSGCVNLGSSSSRRTATHVQSADIASGTPPLAAFVLRLAVTDVPLDGEQAFVASELARESERWARPIDEARAVFIETLVRSAEEGRMAATVDQAAAGVVRATAESAPKYDSALHRLHRALEPSQRRELASRVATRFPGWSADWSGGSPGDHPWLSSIGSDRLERSETDAAATAQRWTDALTKQVRGEIEAPSFDEPARRDLITRLRRSAPK